MGSIAVMVITAFLQPFVFLGVKVPGLEDGMSVVVSRVSCSLCPPRLGLGEIACNSCMLDLEEPVDLWP